MALRETSRGGGGSQAGRRWPGRVAARAGRVPVLLAEEEGDRGEVEMGWAVLGQVSGRQVTSFSLSLLFLFNSVFYFL